MTKSTVVTRSGLSLPTLKKLNKVLGVMCLSGWLLFTIALYMFHYATPAADNIYDSMLGNQPPPQGDVQYADLFLVFLSIGILITLAALILNIILYRARRTHIWLNLILLMVSSASILIYFIRVF